MTDLYTNALEPKVLKIYSELPRLLYNSRLSVLARQYASRDDAIQQAAIGLLEAADRFDAQRGSQFLSFAFWWMRHQLQHGLSTHQPNVISKPVSWLSNTGRGGVMPMAHQGQWQHDDTNDGTVGNELAVDDNIDDTMFVDEFMEWFHRQPMPRRTRAMILARYQRGETLSKLSARYGLAMETVRKHTSQAIEAIRERAAEVGMGVGA